MVPEPLAIDQVAVTGTECPAASRPVALNCCVLDTGTFALAGDTSMDASGPVAAAVTVIVAVPLTFPLAALMVAVPEDVPAL
jgi:hypothetical protein